CRRNVARESGGSQRSAPAEPESLAWVRKIYRPAKLAPVTRASHARANNPGGILGIASARAPAGMNRTGAARDEASTSGGTIMAKLRFLLATTALVAVSSLAGPAGAVDVSDDTSLRNAIFAANTGGPIAINFTGNITLTASLPMITSNVT